MSPGGDEPKQLQNEDFRGDGARHGSALTWENCHIQRMFTNPGGAFAACATLSVEALQRRRVVSLRDSCNLSPGTGSHEPAGGNHFSLLVTRGGNE